MSRRASESPNAADDGVFSAVFELVFLIYQFDKTSPITKKTQAQKLSFKYKLGNY